MPFPMVDDVHGRTSAHPPHPPPAPPTPQRRHAPQAPPAAPLSSGPLALIRLVECSVAPFAGSQATSLRRAPPRSGVVTSRRTTCSSAQRSTADRSHGEWTRPARPCVSAAPPFWHLLRHWSLLWSLLRLLIVFHQRQERQMFTSYWLMVKCVASRRKNLAMYQQHVITMWS